jgi:ketosteroid isomerase-like protein
MIVEPGERGDVAMMLRRAAMGFAVASAVMAAGLAHAQQTADARAKDEAAIRKADADWAKAAQTKQVAAWLAFYTDDAVVLPPNDKEATTKAAIGTVVNQLLILPELKIGWQAEKVEVARAGDLGYARGVYQIAFSAPNGEQIEDHGKYLEIWKKQADGSWKCSVDTWNSDRPQ